jgi:hypothetical protein
MIFPPEFVAMLTAGLQDQSDFVNYKASHINWSLTLCVNSLICLPFQSIFRLRSIPGDDDDILESFASMVIPGSVGDVVY